MLRPTFKREPWGWALHLTVDNDPRGFELSVAWHRRRWRIRDCDHRVTVGDESMARRRVKMTTLGSWLFMLGWNVRPSLDCAGPVLDWSGEAGPGADNDALERSPWAEVDGATAEVLDSLTPGRARVWWGYCLDRVSVDRGFYHQHGLRYELRRSDGVWSIGRLPLVEAS